jgi:hypothetical protein
VPPPDDDDDSLGEFERGRHEMELAWFLRQENILPLESAWNEGRFYGLVLKGNQPFTAFQRLAILVFGLQAMGTGLLVFLVERHFMKEGLSLKVFYQRFPDVPLAWVILLPVVLLNFLFGARVCWVAIKRPPTRIPDEE